MNDQDCMGFLVHSTASTLRPEYLNAFQQTRPLIVGTGYVALGVLCSTFRHEALFACSSGFEVKQLAGVPVHHQWQNQEFLEEPCYFQVTIHCCYLALQGGISGPKKTVNT